MTFGLFSLFRKDADLKSALVDFAESAHGDKKIDVGALKGTSSFTPLWEFRPLYKQAYHRFYFALIHQQLVESFFSKYDTCARKMDMAVMDALRCGQYRSDESRPFKAGGVSGKEIRTAGKRALASCKAAKVAKYAQAPAARVTQKRTLDEVEGAAMLEEIREDGARCPRAFFPGASSA